MMLGLGRKITGKLDVPVSINIRIVVRDSKLTINVDDRDYINTMGKQEVGCTLEPETT